MSKVNVTKTRYFICFSPLHPNHPQVRVLEGIFVFQATAQIGAAMRQGGKKLIEESRLQVPKEAGKGQKSGSVPVCTIQP